MGQQPKNNKTARDLYRIIDIKQPEVRWAVGISVLLEVLFLALSFYSNFSLYENDVCSLIQEAIAGTISLIGVAIGGIAIVIALFTTEQVKIIEGIKEGAFDELLYDFKWFALVSAIEVAILISVTLVIKSPAPIVSEWLFYIIIFIIVYSFFYLLFYGCALIGNLIKLARIKNTLDAAIMQTKSIPVRSIELQLDFLISKLFSGNKETAKGFYNEFVEFIENSSIENKADIVEYLKKRYGKFLV